MGLTGSYNPLHVQFTLSLSLPPSLSPSLSLSPPPPSLSCFWGAISQIIYQDNPVVSLSFCLTHVPRLLSVRLFIKTNPVVYTLISLYFPDTVSILLIIPVCLLCVLFYDRMFYLSCYPDQWIPLSCSITVSDWSIPVVVSQIVYEWDSFVETQLEGYFCGNSMQRAVTCKM